MPESFKNKIPDHLRCPECGCPYFTPISQGFDQNSKGYQKTEYCMNCGEKLKVEFEMKRVSKLDSKGG